MILQRLPGADPAVRKDFVESPRRQPGLEPIFKTVDNVTQFFSPPALGIHCSKHSNTLTISIFRRRVRPEVHSSILFMAPLRGHKSLPAVQGYQRASEIVSVSLTMTLPALCGLWFDSWLGSSPWLLIGGAVLGLGVGLMQVIRISSPSRRPTERSLRHDRPVEHKAEVPPA